MRERIFVHSGLLFIKDPAQQNLMNSMGKAADKFELPVFDNMTG
jgi:hypothetical protein